MATEILIITSGGRGIRMRVSDFPIQKRYGVGVGAIRLWKGDKVVNVIPISAEKEITS